MPKSHRSRTGTSGLVNAFLAACAAVLLALLFAPSPAHSDPTATERELLQGWLRCWETGDLDRFTAGFDPDGSFAYPGGRLTRPELIRTFREYQEGKRDVRLYFGRFLSAGDRFAMEFQFAATDRKTGKRQAVGSAATGTLRDGRIVRWKEYYDEHVAQRQADGVIPLDEGKVYPYPASIMLVPDLIN